MNFFEIVKKRRSVRRFTDKEIPEDVVKKIKELESKLR